MPLGAIYAESRSYASLKLAEFRELVLALRPRTQQIHIQIIAMRLAHFYHWEDFTALNAANAVAAARRRLKC